MNVLGKYLYLKTAVVLLAAYLTSAPVSADIFDAHATQASDTQALSISDTKNQWHNQVSAKGASLGRFSMAPLFIPIAVTVCKRPIDKFIVQNELSTKEVAA